MQESLIISLGWITGIAVALTVGLRDMTDAHPSVELLHQLTQVGAALLVAYSVAIAGFERGLRKKTAKNAHEHWLGYAAGVGMCGLVGIAATLALAAHREAGHANLLDDAGFGWALASIGMLGLFVAALPIGSYEWRRNPEYGPRPRGRDSA
jgi:hypothetical protein